MKIWKILIVIAITGVLVFSSISCSSDNSSTTTTKTMTATVKKGDITLSIVGTGNLALSRTEDLSFETAGTVSEVLVAASDSVTKGQELVKLDSTDWETQIKTLQKAVDTAGDNLTAAKEAVTTAERQVASKELSLQQAQLNLKSAEETLNEIEAVKTAQDAVDAAQYNIDLARAAMQAAAATDNSTEVGYWVKMLSEDKTAPGYYIMMLNQAKANLADVKEGVSVTLDSNAALQIAQAQLQIEQKKAAVEDAQTAIEDTNKAISDAQTKVKDAEEALTEAQANLDETKSLSLVITAPFDGFVTKVNVSGGAEVQKGVIALQIADPAQFEANVQVTENDIFSIVVGGEAVVSLDAIEGKTFPAKITSIAPTATVSSGVVSYKVVVELTSNDSTLKDGLSVTVDIIYQQSKNVLYVPNKAITNQGPNNVVQVVKGTTVETRTVTTGISDDNNTEITSGLSDGEQITYTLSSSSSSSSSSNSNNQQSLQQSLQQGVGGPPPGGF